MNSADKLRDLISEVTTAICNEPKDPEIDDGGEDGNGDNDGGNGDNGDNDGDNDGGDGDN